jgi:hypothetical protein
MILGSWRITRCPAKDSMHTICYNIIDWFLTILWPDRGCPHACLLNLVKESKPHSLANFCRHRIILQSTEEFAGKTLLGAQPLPGDLHQTSPVC